MMAEEGKSRLGRGLAALIGDVGEESAAIERVRSQKRVPIEFLKPNPRNPRRGFAAEELEELAASIRERGIIQPIVVRAARGAADAYEIIAGERRWRAAQMAGLHDVPIVLIEASDKEALEFAIIENVQRENLNAIEEAEGYARLMHEFKYNQDEVAQVVGKSRPHVANTVRLTKLPETAKDFVRDGRLTAGHARLLLGHDDPVALAEEIVRKGWSVRQTEESLTRNSRQRRRAFMRSPAYRKDPNTAALEQRLTQHLGFVVSIDHDIDGSGKVAIRYRTLDQLDEIVRRLASAPAEAEDPDLPPRVQAAARRIREGTAESADVALFAADERLRRGEARPEDAELVADAIAGKPGWEERFADAVLRAADEAAIAAGAPREVVEREAAERDARRARG
jgi:ParB family chromosome partitioning protein